jgi:hypothetical protein
MNNRFLLLAAPFLTAASLPQTLSLQVSPDYPFTAQAPARAPAPSRQAGPVYEPAPLPNPDIAAPRRAGSGGTEVSPSLFQRHGGYRGDALSNDESVESDQNRRFLPSPGLTLRMPLDPAQSQ